MAKARRENGGPFKFSRKGELEGESTQALRPRERFEFFAKPRRRQIRLSGQGREL